MTEVSLKQVLVAYEYAQNHPHKYLRGTTNWCAAVAHSLNQQIATLSPAHVEDGEEVEVVAWQYRVTAGSQTGWSLWNPGKGEEFENSYAVESRPLMTVAQHRRIVSALSAPPASVPAELTNVRCMCGDEYPHDSYGAGFIAGSGMCENCAAAQGAMRDADRKAMDDLKAMSFEELMELSEGAAPPAAGVPEDWREDVSLAAQMLTWGDDDGGLTERQISEIEQHAKKLFGMLAAAPTPPASEQQHDGRMPSDSRNRMWELIDAALTSSVPDALQRGDICNVLAPLLASEQQRAVVMPRRRFIPRDGGEGVKYRNGFNECLDEFLRLNPHLAKGEGV